MMESCYKYIKHGFEGILYDAENGDDRLIIVIQGSFASTFFSILAVVSIEPIPVSIKVPKQSKIKFKLMSSHRFCRQHGIYDSISSRISDRNPCIYV